MTICIAVICHRASTVILASDSMITSEGLSIQFEHPTKKMTCLTEKCIALTAGDALAHTELFTMVEEQISRLKQPSVPEIVSGIKESYQFMREREIKEKFLTPRGFANFDKFYKNQRNLIPEFALSIQNEIDRYDYGLDILVAGISDNAAHIYGIFNPGTSKCFDAIGFHAIGSGLPHAVNTLIARGCSQETSLNEGLLIIYEAKKMAEKAPGVGTNITDICIMGPKQTIDFPREKLEGLQDVYEKWVRKEQDWDDVLDKLLREIGVNKK